LVLAAEHTSGSVGHGESGQVVQAIRPRRRANMRSHALVATSQSLSGGREARPSWGNEAAIGQPTRVKRLPPRMTAKYAHVVDMAKKNPALFIPVKVG